MRLCSILLRRGVVYFLRANIKGEVWLIVPVCTREMWGTFLKFEGGVRGCARLVIIILLPSLCPCVPCQIQIVEHS